MRATLAARLRTSSSWKLVLFSIVGAVLITDTVTGVVSWLVWQEIPPGLLLLGTINATVVPLILAPVLIRTVKRATQLEALNQQLQQEAVERRRAESEREELIQELKAKNTELERFTYTVSHDLKAPLITIRGFMSLLEQDAVAGDQVRLQSDLTRISEATDKMKRLLDELLELSRIGRMMNPPQDVSLATIVQDALDLVHGRLEARGVTVTVAADLPVVHGDRTRLVEVIQNLVDNAVKFMGD